MKIDKNGVIIPLDVSKAIRENYVRNYVTITRLPPCGKGKIL